MKVKIAYLCVMTLCVMALLSCGKNELELMAVEEAYEEGVTGVTGGDAGVAEGGAGASGLGDGVSEADVSGDVVGSGYETDASGDVVGNGYESDASGKDRIYVFIYGAVNHPGVYEIREGARLYELVSLAGGYSQDASVGYNNLAREIFDGEQIYVPTNEEVPESVADSAGTGGSVGASGVAGSGKNKLININTATREELMTLSGIGESRANDIISYRNQHGPFRSIKDIQNVPGIKSGIYEKIKDFITI